MPNKICIENCQQLIKVFELQLNSAENEMMSPSESLGKAFECLYHSVNELIDNFSKSNEENDEIVLLKERINESFQACMIDLQFTDAVSQRILHISNGLEKIDEMFQDSEKFRSYEKWLDLKNTIRDSYSIEEERTIFDKIINDVKENSNIEKSSSENVDLF